jgi:T6SS, Phospholipase effector Tle1-like, catalytic domain
MKKIIILSDGTGNGAAKRHGTNVRRLYNALDLHHPDQIAYYDDGVGSQEFLPLKLLGGIFGYGMKRNVLDMYAFLCRAYRKIDEENQQAKIYLFGFSRGAFTVRVLAGMIDYCGLYKSFKDEQDLIQACRKNYSAFLSKFKRGFLYKLYCKLRGVSDQATGDYFPKIEFIGVWDTVDAYGLPMDELAILWDCFIYPIRFPDRNLSSLVNRACHALSVDDERLTFHPLLWNEGDGTESANKGEKKPEIEQVWFPGVHSDVGGGYAESELALLSLDWMMSKVECGPGNTRGLHFIPGTHDEIKAHSDWHGEQHNSRSGLASLYRYKPRNIETLCNDPEGHVTVKQPKIHRSVFERIRGGYNVYAPTGIPQEYAEIDNDGNPPFETADERGKRRNAMNVALDIVFWRRWLYFALLAATVMLLMSRYFLPYQNQGACDGSACLFDPLLSAVKLFLPDILVGWIEALRQNSFWLWGFLIVFLVLLILKARTSAATQHYAGAAWSKLICNDTPPDYNSSFAYRIRSGAHSKFRSILKWILCFILFLLLLDFIIIGLSRSIMHVRVISGGICKSAGGAPIAENSVTMDISDPCGASGIHLEKGKHYKIVVEADNWFDGTLEASPDEMHSPPFYLAAFVPLRRYMDEPWMRLMGRVGAKGNDTLMIGSGLDDYRAKSNGELFLYVNDAVFGLLPGRWWSLPYTWKYGFNQGTAKISVKLLEKPAI